MTQRKGKLALNIGNLLIECVDEIIHTLLDSGNDTRLTQQGVALVADLGSDLNQSFALHQPLLEFGIDRWWWRPGVGLEPGSQFSQHLRIQVVGFGALEQRLGKIVCLSSFAEQHSWIITEQHIYRDDGSSGASLNRPGLDHLRDSAAQAAFDAVLITAPDRLVLTPTYN